MFSDHSNTGFKLILLHILCTAEYNRMCTLNLIVVELAEVLHIHLAFVGICNCYKTVQFDWCIFSDTLNGLDNV